ncbi:MAG: fumarylacetoacetate hydrolase family protein [Thermoplasmata archaeon]
MRRIRFIDPAGYERYGELENGKIDCYGNIYNIDDVQVLSPCNPTKIICIGRNYADHAEEFDNTIPDRPLLFLKPPNSLSAHNDRIKLLPDIERIEHEAELGVVIKEQCRYVSKEDAMDYVLGYTCFNDISNRDDQKIEQNWVRGKAFDNSAPVGPVLASPDLVQDDATIKLEKNGEVKQQSDISKMVFSVTDLIEEITKYLTLERGDIIATGTPAGVGPIEDGDRIDISIEGIGTLTNYFEK